MRALIISLVAALWAAAGHAHGDLWYDGFVGPTPREQRYTSPHYDVDTLHVTVDLGFMGVRWYGPIRIRCIDGVEIRPLRTRELATVQKRFGEAIAGEHAPAKFLFWGRGKYGRPIMTMTVGGLDYAITVYGEFPDTIAIEAYGRSMIAECREYLGAPPVQAGP